jgi:decaprenylphospho-beta-D-ribofuranose 2-oxidase
MDWEMTAKEPVPDKESRWVEERLTGWGRSNFGTSIVAEPRSESEILEWIGSYPDSPLLARGAGRSYGDTALNSGGFVMRTTAMAGVHSFDPLSGEIVVDPGVSFGQLLRDFSQDGWLAPVTPGTQFATIAGAIANDVHGKDHDAEGSFGDHVLWFDLALPDGTLQRVNAESSPELFAATIGGIGLTGVITRACFRMTRIPGTMIRLRERRAQDLNEFIEALGEARTSCRYSVGWIDAVATGKHLGRGILETADFADHATPARAVRRFRLPMDFPSWAMNSLSVGLFNRLYYQRVPAKGREREISLEQFFYPLDAILDWNRMYGRRGFVQFQCVIPDAEVHRGLPTLLARIAASGQASFLAVIKTLGGAGRGHLSFPMRGMTLALDFPRKSGVDALLTSLHALTADYGGRVYLAKDSALTPAQFRRMYPAVPTLQAVLARIDPRRRMRSDMSHRLQL